MSIYEAGLAVVEMRSTIGPEHAAQVAYALKQQQKQMEEKSDELTTATEE